jgi:hypothetical protein
MLVFSWRKLLAALRAARASSLHLSSNPIGPFGRDRSEAMTYPGALRASLQLSGRFRGGTAQTVQLIHIM